MGVCSATKRNGEPCTLQATEKDGLCWAHSPQHHEHRRKRAIKGGRGRANKAIKDLHELLKDLTDQVIAGELDTSRGAVANQLIGTRIRLLEHERRAKELGEVLERLEALEQKASLHTNPSQGSAGARQRGGIW